MDTRQREQHSTTEKTGYKHNWGKWIAIYLAVAAIAYLIVYFVAFHHGGGGAGGAGGGY
jgi:hypothetical protein